MTINIGSLATRERESERLRKTLSLLESLLIACAEFSCTGTAAMKRIEERWSRRQQQQGPAGVFLGVLRDVEDAEAHRLSPSIAVYRPMA